jgi:hypothetical protein
MSFVHLADRLRTVAHFLAGLCPFGHVADERDHAHNGALGVVEGPGADGGVKVASVLTMGDGFSGPSLTGEDATARGIEDCRRDDKRAGRTANSFVCGAAVHLLRGLVPERDVSFSIGGDNRLPHGVEDLRLEAVSLCHCHRPLVQANAAEEAGKLRGDDGEEAQVMGAERIRGAAADKEKAVDIAVPDERGAEV